MPSTRCCADWDGRSGRWSRRYCAWGCPSVAPTRWSRGCSRSPPCAWASSAITPWPRTRSPSRRYTWRSWCRWGCRTPPPTASASISAPAACSKHAAPGVSASASARCACCSSPGSSGGCRRPSSACSSTATPRPTGRWPRWPSRCWRSPPGSSCSTAPRTSPWARSAVSRTPAPPSWSAWPATGWSACRWPACWRSRPAGAPRASGGGWPAAWPARPSA